MRFRARIPAVGLLLIAVLANTSGICMCCQPPATVEHAHACCGAGGPTITDQGVCCVAMTGAVSRAVVESAPPPVAALHHSDPWTLGADGPAAPAVGHPVAGATLAHSPPSSVLRI